MGPCVDVGVGPGVSPGVGGGVGAGVFPAVGVGVGLGVLLGGLLGPIILRDVVETKQQSASTRDDSEKQSNNQQFHVPRHLITSSQFRKFSCEINA